MTPTPSYATTADGLLLIADGLNPVRRWDGLSAAPSDAGLAAPSAAVSLAASGSGAISGTYYAYLRYADAQDNFSDLSPLSAPLAAAGAGAVDYSGLQSPSDPRVVRRQVLRNTAGQASVFYVDVDTADLASASLSSARADALLSAQPAVPLFDPAGLPLANAHGRPPDWKRWLASHRDRMFAAGEVVYRDGTVAVAGGSAAVRGAGTAWPATFAGRWLWVDGAPAPYEVASVDVAAQALTLLSPYAGPTDPYARYAVRPAPAEQRLVYFSAAGEPESWPAFNALGLPADDDDVTGLMPMGSWVFFLERRHVYRCTYKDSPSADGAVFLAVDRGCVNDECWVVVEGVAYLLDESGVYSFDGGEGVTPLSGPVQDLWESEHSRPGELRIQWAARDAFHCVWYPAQEVVRWFVTLAGRGRPRHALCYEVRRQRWWVEEFARPVASSCLGRLGGVPKVFLGGPAGDVLAFGVGALDGADDSLGTVRGSVTSASALSLADARAAFHPSSAGCPVAVASGRGGGQVRVVTGVTPTRLAVDRPWAVLPDATSTYQVGGVSWRYRTGWLRWAADESLHPRRLEVVFGPARRPCSLSARLLPDRSAAPAVFAADYGPEYNRFSSAAGSPDLVADLTKPSGFVQRRLDGRKDAHADGPRFVAVELAGVTNADPVAVFGVAVDGAQT